MTEERGFRAMLKARQKKIKSLISVGLDPLAEKLPPHLKSDAPYSAHLATDIAIWMMMIVDKTAPFTSMYKIQRASWEAIPGGVIAMQMLISYIKTYYSDIPVFVDCKRGDIGRTQQQYRIAHLEIDGADGMNFSPYMGRDCMEFLFDDINSIKSLVGLCYTSNPASREMQDVLLADGRKYWEFVATTTLRWAEELNIVENSGLVMAAAYEFPKKSGQVYSEHLSRCRELVGDKLWFLVPGVGTQGGYIKETVKAGFTGYGSMSISSSSDIIFASSKENFAEAAGEKTRQLYLAIAEALGINDDDLIPESRIVLHDPLATLKRCNGYYLSPKDGDGKFLGPAVGYAGQYATDEGPKNYVGFEYFNFAKAEQYHCVRSYFAELIDQKLKKAILHYSELEIDAVLGAPMGGILFADSVSQQLNCRVIFSEKKVTDFAQPDNGIKEKSKQIIDRHEIRPGDKIAIVEDVTNNFSTTDALIKLIQQNGGTVVAIICAFNRSVSSCWHDIPVISALEIPTDQFRQDEPEVAGLIGIGNIIWKPKDEWAPLKKAMELDCPEI